MYAVGFHDGSYVLVEAFSFDVMAEHKAIVFFDESGNLIGFYDRELVKSVFKREAPQIVAE